jgi:hypothetical protein
VRFNGTIIGEHGDVDITLDGSSGSSVWIAKGIEHTCVMMCMGTDLEPCWLYQVHYMHLVMKENFQNCSTTSHPIVS